MDPQGSMARFLYEFLCFCACDCAIGVAGNRPSTNILLQDERGEHHHQLLPSFAISFYPKCLPMI